MCSEEHGQFREDKGMNWRIVVVYKAGLANDVGSPT